MKVKQIAAGIIIHNGKVLLAQRKKGKDLEFKWELPGGKLEEGETLPQCLKRELIEELNLEVEVEKLFLTTEYAYEFGKFVLNTFIAKCKNPFISKTDAHEQYVWADPQTLLDYDLAPADIPIVQTYIKSI